MSEEKLPAAVYRELLADTRESIKTVKKMMKSESEDVQVFAVDAFLKLSSLAAALAEQGVSALRTIFTDRDRRLLERWLEEDEETGETRKLFTWIRRNTPQLLSDLKLMNRVITKLKKRKRWRGRIVGGSEFASASRRAESASSRTKREGAT